MEKSSPLDRRRAERVIAEPDAWLAWTDPGRGVMHLRGRCLDVSEDGVCVELDCALPVGVAVTFAVPIRRLQKRASVRHCTPAGCHFAVGLEYA